MESTPMATSLVLSIFLAVAAGGELLNDLPKQMNMTLPKLPLPTLPLPTLPLPTLPLPKLPLPKLPLPTLPLPTLPLPTLPLPNLPLPNLPLPNLPLPKLPLPKLPLPTLPLPTLPLPTLPLPTLPLPTLPLPTLPLPTLPVPPVKLNLPTLPTFTSISKPECGADEQGSLGCCIRLEPSGDDVCLSFITDLETLSLEVALKVSGVTRLSTKISGSSLPPVCFIVPPYPLMQLCGSLSNVTVENGAVKFCSRMEVKIPETAVGVDFDCLKIGINGLELAYVS